MLKFLWVPLQPWEKQSAANNTGLGEDLSEVAILFTIAIVGILPAGVHRRSVS